jgi:hypothetical protein
LIRVESHRVTQPRHRTGSDALGNRTKDWADLEEMRDAGTLDVARVIAVLVEYGEWALGRVRRDR